MTAGLVTSDRVPAVDQMGHFKATLSLQSSKATSRGIGTDRLLGNIFHLLRPMLLDLGPKCWPRLSLEISGGRDA